MRLAEFYNHIGPYLLGQRDHDEVVRRLYGQDSERKTDAERLVIYQKFCRLHRQESLESVFVYCRDAVVGKDGAAAWDALVESYFVAHPMHHFELNQNGIHFPAFVAELGAAGELPAFLGELADLEWWEWVTDTLRDDPADENPDLGPIRLHSTVELRPYKYDLLRWIDEDARKPVEPAAKSSVVLFFRDRELDARREKATRLEMLVIKAVVESIALDAELAERMGVTFSMLCETVADLHAAGIILGAV